MSGPLIVLDIGSTLVDGSPRDPARRIAELAGLDVPGKRSLHRLLMTTDFTGPEQVRVVAGERLGLTGSGLESAIAEVWVAQESEARPIPGAFESLESFVAKGYRLALLSNIWTPYLRSVQRLLGEFFSTHIPANLQLFSCREGIAKPAPELFRRLLERADVEPAQVVMVGDSYDKDIEPAIACGMRTLWLLHESSRNDAALTRVRGGAAPAPDLTLGSLGDLDLDGTWLTRMPAAPATAE